MTTVQKPGAFHSVLVGKQGSGPVVISRGTVVPSPAKVREHTLLRRVCTVTEWYRWYGEVRMGPRPTPACCCARTILHSPIMSAIRVTRARGVRRCLCSSSTPPTTPRGCPGGRRVPGAQVGMQLVGPPARPPASLPESTCKSTCKSACQPVGLSRCNIARVLGCLDAGFQRLGHTDR